MEPTETSANHVANCGLCLEGITSGSEVGYVPDVVNEGQTQLMHMDCAISYVDGWGDWTHGVVS